MQPTTSFIPKNNPKSNTITLTQIRILHETDKAVLVDAGMKIWIPKSRIRGIRLNDNVFEIYVAENTVGEDQL